MTTIGRKYVIQHRLRFSTHKLLEAFKPLCTPPRSHRNAHRIYVRPHEIICRNGGKEMIVASNLCSNGELTMSLPLGLYCIVEWQKTQTKMVKLEELDAFSEKLDQPILESMEKCNMEVVIEPSESEWRVPLYEGMLTTVMTMPTGYFLDFFMAEHLRWQNRNVQMRVRFSTNDTEAPYQFVVDNLMYLAKPLRQEGGELPKPTLVEWSPASE